MAIRILTEEDKVELEQKIASGSLTAEQISALNGMFKIASFTSDPTEAYTAFKTAFGIADEEEPDEPVVTMTGISAVYSGGDVPVGTAVSDLTGVVVTAMYSDGTSETVTGYTLSGEIAEGSNTITVSYGGKTTNFTVTGVAERASSYVAFSDIEGGLTTEGTGYYVGTCSQQYNVARFTAHEQTATYLIPCMAGQTFEIWSLNFQNNRVNNISKEVGESLMANASTGTAVNLTTGTVYDGYTDDFVVTVNTSVKNEELNTISGQTGNFIYATCTAFIDGYILVNNINTRELYIKVVA